MKNSQTYTKFIRTLRQLSMVKKVKKNFGFDSPKELGSFVHTVRKQFSAQALKPYLNFQTRRLLRELPGQGIFMTGIESSDPWVDNRRRNQLKEAHDFYEHYQQRLRNIKELGVNWLRFGLPYSEAHPAPRVYEFTMFEKVEAECRSLGITLVADMLHFGLPEWMHAGNPDAPFFQNPNFPELFAEYAKVFAERFPEVRYFTVVNEPFVTAHFSAKLGIWNEKLVGLGNNNSAFIRAICNIAKAAVLGREAIEGVRKKQHKPAPIFVQNESFEKAFAEAGSGREAEAENFNLRRFAALDLIFGIYDSTMETFLAGQGISRDEYWWFMNHGSRQRVILGIDHYPWCIHTYGKESTRDHTPHDPYRLYELSVEYYKRYQVPLLHTEINAWPEFAKEMCLLTYLDLLRLRNEGIPVVGMTWYGDEYQVGWHHGLVGPGGFEETPVGLYYKGAAQPVAETFKRLLKQGFLPMKNSPLDALRKSLHSLSDYLTE